MGGGLETLVEGYERSIWWRTGPLERRGELQRIRRAKWMQAKHAQRLFANGIAGLNLVPTLSQGAQ